MTKRKDPLKVGAFERRSHQLRQLFKQKAFQETVVVSLTGAYEKALRNLVTAEGPEKLMRAQGEFAAVKSLLEDLLNVVVTGDAERDARLKIVTELTQGD